MTPDQPDRPPLRFPPSDALQRLRERYRASAPQLTSVFRQLATALAVDPRSPAAIDGVRASAHRLRGTAGTYGFEQVSQLAQALEGRAAHWDADPDEDVASRATAVAAFADAVEAAFADG
jgi:chemotaxis protein histidine kinase CheA